MDDPEALAELKAADAQLNGGSLQYDDATYQKLLTYYRAYRDARAVLRALPLGDVQALQAMPAGGVK